MRLLEHTLSSDASIHLGGLVVKGIPASDLITHAVPPRAARANTKHLHLYSLCSEIEKANNYFTVILPVSDSSPTRARTMYMPVSQPVASSK